MLILLIRYPHMGGLLIAIFVWQACMERKISQREPAERFTMSTWPSLLAVCLAGMFSGFLGGLFAAPGPPLMVFVLLTNISKDEWRGTSSLFTLVCLVPHTGSKQQNGENCMGR